MMTTFADHFRVDYDALTPQPWMQLRQVASESVPSVSRNYDPSDGEAKNEAVQAVTAQWVNDTPIRQYIYGLVTRGGAAMALQARSRAYLSMRHGWRIEAGPGFEMFEVSRFGIGSDIGQGGMLAVGTGFGMAGWQEYSNTIEFMPHITGEFLLEPGEQFNARAEVAFVSEFWENSVIDGGERGTESGFISGELQLDLWAKPVIDPPPQRLTPAIVGGAFNIQHDEEIDLVVADQQLSVTKPSGLAVGDVLVALVFNDFGSYREIAPAQSGWAFVHGRNGDLFGVIPGDSHVKMWMRTVEDPESLPATFEFTNGAFASGIAVVFALRDTAAFEGSDGGSGWYVGSNLSRPKLADEQAVPSFARGGQLLLAFSYISSESWTAPVDQDAPDGMTELIQIQPTRGSLSMALLNNPPNPTLERRFIHDDLPVFFGHSITVGLLVPGALDI